MLSQLRPRCELGNPNISRLAAQKIYANPENQCNSLLFKEQGDRAILFHLEVRSLTLEPGIGQFLEDRRAKTIPLPPNRDSPHGPTVENEGANIDLIRSDGVVHSGAILTGNPEVL